tara:strand:+ start:970 stop:1206 length:237 start_codon:yes stop_codon:yes gene_type:complete
MAVFDPGKMGKAIILTNKVGAVAGGIAGFLLIQKYSIQSSTIKKALAVIAGVVAGGYAQNALKTKGQFLKTAQFARTK